MTSDPITCDEARQILWPDPARPARHDARAHYDECEACQRFFAGQRTLRGRLSNLGRVKAPEGLRDRILADIDADRTFAAPRGRGRRMTWAGVAVAAAAALAVVVGLRAPGKSGVAMPFVTEAARVLTPSAAFQSRDPAAIEDWLTRQVGHPVDLPDITDARLVGGRVVNVAGVQTAAGTYEFHGMPLTYFALRVSQLGRLRMRPESEILSAAAEGYEVAVWREPAGLRAVAAPMARDEVTAVATECRDKALLRS